jgi:hypothetical protein
MQALNLSDNVGRTIPSFRMTLTMEKEEWKPFRNALDKSEKKQFDDMFDIPRLYLLACSNSCQLVPLQPIMMSIIFHHYKELTEIISEVEKIEKAKVNNTSQQHQAKIDEGGKKGRDIRFFSPLICPNRRFIVLESITEEDSNSYRLPLIKLENAPCQG